MVNPANAKLFISRYDGRGPPSEAKTKMSELRRLLH